MIALLNISHRDREQALHLLEWTGSLGGVGRHDIILQVNQIMKHEGAEAALAAEAGKHFASVSVITPPSEEERGWPWSANHAWMHALQVVFTRIQKPWLWLEPDCLPLCSDWLDRIEAEYERGRKPFMGAEVRAPEHRMSGIGVYPPKVIAYLRRRVLGDLQRDQAFDSFFAPEIVPHAHFTTLIQNIWSVENGKNIAPTFPDAASLAMLDPQAVLFHRCKDGSLLERLTEGRKPSTAGCVSGLNVSADAGLTGATQEPGAFSGTHVRPAGSTPAPATTRRRKRGKSAKVKPKRAVRTPALIEAARKGMVAA